MSGIAKSVLKSIITTILLALIFSLWNDFFYKKDRLTGFWKVEFENTESSYSKYIGLKTYYEYVIGQAGNSLSGSGEKVSEDSANGVIVYDHDKRTHLDFKGALTYRFLSKNIVDLTQKEKGRLRPSSTVVKLMIESNDRMSGTFMSTIAATRGKVVFTRVK